MKNIKILAALLCGSALVFSCNKNELVPEEQPEAEGIKLTIHAGVDTKTSIGTPVEGVYKTSWNEYDGISVFVGAPEKENNETFYSFLTTAGEVGSFTCKVNIPAALAGEQTLYAIYDAASVVDANAVHHNVYQDNSVRATIPQVQTCTSTSFDPAADVLFAKPVTTTLVAEGDNEVTMQFGRPVSIIKLNVTSSATTIPAGTNLKGIKLTAGDTDYLTGYAQLDITGTTAPSAGISKWVSNSSYSLVELNC